MEENKDGANKEEINENIISKKNSNNIGKNEEKKKSNKIILQDKDDNDDIVNIEENINIKKENLKILIAIKIR